MRRNLDEKSNAHASGASCAAAGSDALRLRRKDARRDAGAAPSETLTQPPADPAPETPSETPQEEPFVPDYAPGEEVTDSIRADSDLYFGALAAQQGRWLYYGVADGTGGWECSSHTYAIVKLPLGGTAEDRVVLMTINDLHMDFNLACQRCGKDTTTYGTIKDIIGTLGDWIYLTVDEHILRLRTDGRIMESVLCLKPDGQTTHTYLAIRDNMLYYLAAERRPVSASQTEDTWTIRKLDLAGGETRDVGAVPVPVTMAGWCGDALILQDFKDLDHCNAYVLGPDDSLTFCENWSFIYDKDYFGYFSILPGYAGEEMILFGELISHGLDGIYRMSREDLEGFAKQDYYIPKVGETQVGLYPVPIYDLSPFSAFLLPGTEDFSETTVSYGCGVEDGFCFTDAFDGLFYYSETDKTVRQLNEDKAENLLWPGDGYLYYVCTIKAGGGYFDGIYRIRLDGTGWEDMSWMVASVNG